MLDYLKYHIKLSPRSRYVLLFCFMFGILWGAFVKTQRWQTSLQGHLNLLVLNDTIPQDIIETYRISEKVVMNVTYAKDETDFLNILNLGGSKFDMVTLLSNHVPRLIKLNKLMPLENKWIENKKNISIDFKYPPYDNNARYTVPILWGVQNIIDQTDRGLAAEFTTKELGTADNEASLWTLNLSVISGATNEKEAHKFINYLLDKKVSMDLAKITNKSVTNNLVENSNLLKTLKPSYIRSIPLRNLKYKIN